ncbi:Vanin-like protein 1 [Blattella germanica]|nr:Vanin-like protein 1 [Blattella germanica]
MFVSRGYPNDKQAHILTSVKSKSNEKSTQESPTYVAAVVEYSPDIYETTGNENKDVLVQNAEHYVDIIRTAANESTDIIVFPECGLKTLGKLHTESTLVPDPEEGANPCLSSSTGVHEAVRIISCAAREYQMYRKFNLFGEPGFNATKTPDMSVFETDFGVKFGIFTCFDIIFERPAVTLVKDMGITDIIFPTAWFSELPFLTAVQEQVAWSRGLGVNFLGSGYNNPSGGSTGSGIYSPKQGVLTSIMATTRTTKLLVASVPKLSSQSTNVPPTPAKIITHAEATVSKDDSTGISMKKDFLLSYITFLLPNNLVPVKKTLCYGDLCCDFDVKFSSESKSGYFYRLAVFDGVRSFTYATGGLQICALIFCEDETISSCGVELKDPEQSSSATFDHINITGNFNLEHAMQLPNTLLTGYDVLSPTKYNFVKEEDISKNSVKVNMFTKTEPVSVLTFGIYGRNFLRDGEPSPELKQISKNSSSGVVFAVYTIACSVVFTFAINKIYQ